MKVLNKIFGHYIISINKIGEIVMRQFTIKDEEKEAILLEAKHRLEVNKNTYRNFSSMSKLRDRDKTELQDLAKIISNEQIEISRLEKYGVISENFMRLFNIPFMSITLTTEDKEKIRKDVANSKDKDLWDKYLESDKIKFNILKGLYTFDENIRNFQIKLNQDLISRLNLIQDYMIQGKKNKIDLSKGYISFSNFCHIASNILDKKAITNIQTKYDKGIITNDELSKEIYEQVISKSLQEFEMVYEKKRESDIRFDINAIIESQSKLKGKVSDYVIEQINQLVKPLAGQSLDNVDIDKAEQIIAEYNIIANKAWQVYLNEKDKFLIHTSRYDIKGEYDYPIISTSLCYSTNTNDLRTYGTDNSAYIIRPKHIMCADSKDLGINNDVTDKYSARTYRIVKFPQIIEEESRNKPDFQYSEIACDKFEIVGVMCFGRNTNELGLKRLQNRAEAFKTSDGKPLPIKFLTEYGLVTAQERDNRDYLRDKNKAYEEINSVVRNCNKLLNRRAYLSKLANANKLYDYRAEKNSEGQYINELYLTLKRLNFDSLNRKDLVKIAQDIKASFSNQMWDKLNEYDNNNYLKSLNTRVQDLIVEAKKSRIDSQILSLKNEKVNIFQRVFGRSKLNKIMIQNLELKKYTILSESPEELTEDSIMQELFDYIQKEGMTANIHQFLTNYNIEADNKIPCETRIREILSREKLRQGEVQRALIPTDKIRLRDISGFIRRAQSENLQLQGKVQEQKLNRVEKNKLNIRLDSNDPTVTLTTNLRRCKSLIEEFLPKEEVQKDKQLENEDR